MFCDYAQAVNKLGKFTIENNVSEQTSHVVSLENRRTVNLLRGIIRGLWILTYDWIEKSLAANEWQPEELYEMKTFSKAVQVNLNQNQLKLNYIFDYFFLFHFISFLKICRMERQAFGSKHYKMDILLDVGPIFVSLDCKCDALTELIKLCSGKVTKNRSMAKIIIADRVPSNSIVLINMIKSNWILDSISNGKLLKHQHYRLSNAHMQYGKENEVRITKQTQNIELN